MQVSEGGRQVCMLPCRIKHRLHVAFVGGSYFLILYIFQRFIYRKIKLIYKFIYQTKASKKEEMYNKYILPQKSIDEVRQDVEAWADQRRKEIELLKENEQFRKEFLQNLSHEFKTPLTLIRGPVDSLMEEHEMTFETRSRYYELIQKNTQRLLRLVNQVLDLSAFSV